MYNLKQEGTNFLPNYPPTSIYKQLSKYEVMYTHSLTYHSDGNLYYILQLSKP